MLNGQRKSVQGTVAERFHRCVLRKECYYVLGGRGTYRTYDIHLLLYRRCHAFTVLLVRHGAAPLPLAGTATLLGATLWKRTKEGKRGLSSSYRRQPPSRADLTSLSKFGVDRARVLNVPCFVGLVGKVLDYVTRLASLRAASSADIETLGDYSGGVLELIVEQQAPAAFINFRLNSSSACDHGEAAPRARG